MNTKHLLISVCYPNGDYHGKEWPPAPMRLFQAIVAGLGSHYGMDDSLPDDAVGFLEWLEGLRPPSIYVENLADGVEVNTYVPHGSPKKENVAKGLATLRGKSMIRRHVGKAPVHYAWSFNAEDAPMADAVADAASHVYRLGRGPDMAWARAEVVDRVDLEGFRKLSPSPSPPRGGVGYLSELYVPVPGLLKKLFERQRRDKDAEIPYDIRYYSLDANGTRHFAVYQPFDQAGGKMALPANDTTALVGMIRGALSAMRSKDNAGILSFAIGHYPDDYAGDLDYRLSWLPLPSVGHEEADGKVRRLMVLAPNGCGRDLFDKSVSGLDMSALVRVDDHSLAGYLRKVDEDDGVVRSYLGVPNGLSWSPSKSWRTVTPVVLPGHPFRNGRLDFTLLGSLVRKCLSGKGLPEIEDIGVSRAPYRKGGFLAGTYAVPAHYKGAPQYHVSVVFREPIMGPLMAGRARHYGVGLFEAFPG